VNFIRQVENSDTFFLITAIDLTGGNSAQAPNSQTSNISNTNASTGSGNVALSLALETYFYQ